MSDTRYMTVVVIALSVAAGFHDTALLNVQK